MKQRAGAGGGGGGGGTVIGSTAVRGEGGRGSWVVATLIQAALSQLAPDLDQLLAALTERCSLVLWIIREGCDVALECPQDTAVMVLPETIG